MTDKKTTVKLGLFISILWLKGKEEDNDNGKMGRRKTI